MFTNILFLPKRNLYFRCFGKTAKSSNLEPKTSKCCNPKPLAVTKTCLQVESFQCGASLILFGCTFVCLLGANGFPLHLPRNRELESALHLGHWPQTTCAPPWTSCIVRGRQGAGSSLHAEGTISSLPSNSKWSFNGFHESQIDFYISISDQPTVWQLLIDWLSRPHFHFFLSLSTTHHAAELTSLTMTYCLVKAGPQEQSSLSEGRNKNCELSRQLLTG